jgi:hypothetical protein
LTTPNPIFVVIIIPVHTSIAFRGDLAVQKRGFSMYNPTENKSSTDRPKRRPLKIYASDPMTGRNLGNRARVDVENEELKPGPSGQRIMVLDYNSTTGKHYPPVDLDEPGLLMQGGLDPSESDPRFHQQMVYAVAMRTLENFDRALGRRIFLNKRGRPLRIFPHAFYGANAYFDEDLHAILFGYFRADDSNPGENLPGQTVFTCLSHDIIAHEMTHAIVNRLRRNFLEPSNQDVLAFHEGFSDLVALFQHFSFIDVVKAQIQKTGYDLREATDLLGLAPQFGHATASGGALRSALGKPELRLSDDICEPHERGAILVAAVFDAFILVYERRTADLARLIGLQKGDQQPLHPDMVNRLAAEAVRIAQSMLTMCIRAFDYMPPVDVTFGDFLRAMVTADVELAPDDEIGQRAAIIEGFRQRGIYPDGVQSLAQESLVWDPADTSLPPLRWEPTELLDVIVDAASQVSASSMPQQNKEIFRYSINKKSSSGVSPSAEQYDSPTVDYSETVDEHTNSASDLAQYLQRYATANALQLRLNPKYPIRALGVHPVFRVAPNGKLVIELIAQVDQKISDRVELEKFGGLSPRGGTTLVIGFDGLVKYAVAKPLPNESLPETIRQQAKARLSKQQGFLLSADSTDAMLPYLDPDEFARRAMLRASMSNLHFSR